MDKVCRGFDPAPPQSGVPRPDFLMATVCSRIPTASIGFWRRNPVTRL